MQQKLRAMQSFKHQPLDLEEGAFRLLKLLHGDEWTIECEVFHTLLGDSESTISYDALSYTWDGGVTTGYILIGGKRLDITSNLHSALRHLRDPLVDRILWVDAICINQSDEAIHEKSHQVRQMRKMYEQADRVIIWLGGATMRPML